MKRYEKRVAKAEEFCNQLFIQEFGDKFDSLYRPRDTYAQYDILALKDDVKYIFEIKYSPKYKVDDFCMDGAMIEIDKWNFLADLTHSEKNVFYLRFYQDGYVIWLINAVDVNKCTKTFYTRKVVTVSNSNNNTYKKRDCLLLPFNEALGLKRNDLDYMLKLSALKKEVKKRGPKSPQHASI